MAQPSSHGIRPTNTHHSFISKYFHVLPPKRAVRGKACVFSLGLSLPLVNKGGAFCTLSQHAIHTAAQPEQGQWTQCRGIAQSGGLMRSTTGT